MDMWAMFKIRSNVALQHDLCDKTSSLVSLQVELVASFGIQSRRSTSSIDAEAL